jgi:hypothetical protein
MRPHCCFQPLPQLVQTSSTWRQCRDPHRSTCCCRESSASFARSGSYHDIWVKQKSRPASRPSFSVRTDRIMRLVSRGRCLAHLKCLRLAVVSNRPESLLLPSRAHADLRTRASLRTTAAVPRTDGLRGSGHYTPPARAIVKVPDTWRGREVAGRYGTHRDGGAGGDDVPCSVVDVMSNEEGRSARVSTDSPLLIR